MRLCIYHFSIFSSRWKILQKSKVQNFSSKHVLNAFQVISRRNLFFDLWKFLSPKMFPRHWKILQKSKVRNFSSKHVFYAFQMISRRKKKSSEKKSFWGVGVPTSKSNNFETRTKLNNPASRRLRYCPEVCKTTSSFRIGAKLREEIVFENDPKNTPKKHVFRGLRAP